MRDWVKGGPQWQSLGVSSNGNSYGIPEGLIFSFPITIKDGKYTIVPGLNIDNEYSQKLLKITSDELLSERAAVEHLLK